MEEDNLNHAINLLNNKDFQLRFLTWKYSGSPSQAKIEWDLDSWIAELPEHTKFLKQLHTRHFGRLNREIVKACLSEYKSEEELVEGFITVMIWGYTADKRGPSRTKRILSQKVTRESLVTAATYLASGDIPAAFDQLVKFGPKHLGPSFATKFLYFLGNSDLAVQPLIFDSVISEALMKWVSFKIPTQTLSSKKYMDYLTFMNESASKLRIDAEDLEFFLFSEYLSLGVNRFWSVRDMNSELPFKEKVVLA